MKKRRQNVGIVAFPICEAGNVPFSNLVDILHRFFDSLYVITGKKERILFKKDNKLHVFEVQHKGGAGLIGEVVSAF